MKPWAIGVFGGVALFCGLWVAFVRAPGPERVCDHIVEVTVAEATAAGMSVEAEASLVEGLRDRCVQHKRDKIQLRGRIKYARYAKCVLEQDSLADIEAC